MKQPHWKKVGKSYWQLFNFGNEWVSKIEVKGTVHKHCTVVDKAASVISKLTILILLYLYTATRQLAKWEARFLTTGVDTHR